MIEKLPPPPNQARSSTVSGWLGQVESARSEIFRTPTIVSLFHAGTSLQREMRGKAMLAQPK